MILASRSPRNALATDSIAGLMGRVPTPPVGTVRTATPPVRPAAQAGALQASVDPSAPSIGVRAAGLLPTTLTRPTVAPAVAPPAPAANTGTAAGRPAIQPGQSGAPSISTNIAPPAGLTHATVAAASQPISPVNPPAAPAIAPPAPIGGTGTATGGPAIQPGQSGAPVVTPTVTPTPPPVAPPTTVAPGVATQTIDPTADLRSQAILPTADPRLTQANTLLDQSVGNLATGPDRTALAQQALKDFDTANQKGDAQRYLAIGQNAAKFGRIGMADTERQTQDLGLQMDQERNAYKNQLAKEVADGTINDRFQTVSTLGNYGTGINAADAAARDEYRGERGYQTGAAQSATDNAANERKLQEDLANSAFNRDLATAGVGQNLSTLEGALAQGHEAGAQGSAQDIGALLQAYALQQAMGQQGGAPAAADPTAGLPDGVTIDDLLAALKGA